MKKFLKRTFPGAVRFVTGFFYGWKGNYKTWQTAAIKCSGYNAGSILPKVREATLKVKNREFPYERDSVVFDKIAYSFPLLSALMWVAAQNKGSLNVLDYGGSLGSTYYQNKQFLDALEYVKWNIVEQVDFVEVGQKDFVNNTLEFYKSIGDCTKSNKIDLVILSSVLPYLEKPYDLLEKLSAEKFKYILVDRTAFITGKDRITIQKVHPKIYKASYPCWFFNEAKFLSFMRNNYKLVYEFDAFGDANIKSKFKGFLFERKPDK